jgi:hypothetical protein
LSLKYVVDTLDSVPEAHRSLYTEANGKFVLGVEGVTPKERVDEFRENNVALKRQLDEMTAKFAGIDPEQARALSERAQKERDKKLIDAGKVDELVSERVTAMRAEHDAALVATRTEALGLRAALENLVVDNSLRDAAARNGVRPEAIEDVLLRGKRVFSLDGNIPVAKDGDKPIFGKTGEPIGINEWVTGLAAVAPHLFQASTGGGGRGAPGASSSDRVNRDDQAGFLANLEKIAAGKMVAN